MKNLFNFKILYLLLLTLGNNLFGAWLSKDELVILEQKNRELFENSRSLPENQKLIRDNLFTAASICNIEEFDKILQDNSGDDFDKNDPSLFIKQCDYKSCTTVLHAVIKSENTAENIYNFIKHLFEKHQPIMSKIINYRQPLPLTKNPGNFFSTIPLDIALHKLYNSSAPEVAFICKLLLENGASTNIKPIVIKDSAKTKTFIPLIFALKFMDHTIFELLLKHSTGCDKKKILPQIQERINKATPGSIESERALSIKKLLEENPTQENPTQQASSSSTPTVVLGKPTSAAAAEAVVAAATPTKMPKPLKKVKLKTAVPKVTPRSTPIKTSTGSENTTTTNLTEEQELNARSELYNKEYQERCLLERSHKMGYETIKNQQFRKLSQDAIAKEAAPEAAPEAVPEIVLAKRLFSTDERKQLKERNLFLFEKSRSLPEDLKIIRENLFKAASVCDIEGFDNILQDKAFKENLLFYINPNGNGLSATVLHAAISSENTTATQINNFISHLFANHSQKMSQIINYSQPIPAQTTSESTFYNYTSLDVALAISSSKLTRTCPNHQLIEVSKSLLGKGAATNISSYYIKSGTEAKHLTQLQYAVSFNNADMVALLIKNISDFCNQRDRDLIRHNLLFLINTRMESNTTHLYSNLDRNNGNLDYFINDLAIAKNIKPLLSFGEFDRLLEEYRESENKITNQQEASTSQATTQRPSSSSKQTEVLNPPQQSIRQPVGQEATLINKLNNLIEAWKTNKSEAKKIAQRMNREERSQAIGLLYDNTQCSNLSEHDQASLIDIFFNLEQEIPIESSNLTGENTLQNQELKRETSSSKSAEAKPEPLSPPSNHVRFTQEITQQSVTTTVRPEVPKSPESRTSEIHRPRLTTKLEVNDSSGNNPRPTLKLDNVDRRDGLRQSEGQSNGESNSPSGNITAAHSPAGNNTPTENDTPAGNDNQAGKYDSGEGLWSFVKTHPVNVLLIGTLVASVVCAAASKKGRELFFKFISKFRRKITKKPDQKAKLDNPKATLANSKTTLANQKDTLDNQKAKLNNQKEEIKNTKIVAEKGLPARAT